MQNTQIQRNNMSLSAQKIRLPRKTVIAVILVVALLAFEIFNFDTTRFALQDLLGNVEFIGLQWAAILAVAFCSIDFAGLVRLFTPEQGAGEPKEVWYLMGAWLLGATMNAVMTWWAVSLTLLNHEFGNEVLGREQLLHWVPIFVTVLVWLTRILFIGAFSVAGEHIFDFSGKNERAATVRQQSAAASPQPLRATNNQPNHNGRSRYNPRPQRVPTRQPALATSPPQPQPIYAATDDVPNFLEQYEPVPAQPTRVTPRSGNKRKNSRVRQRPPVPTVRRVPAGGIQARGRQ
ncbi:MAG: hypothetical protein CSA11_03510 [Chloroflexi bacterium]|nr:MAG: hypothetical protein CSA11_03510 [Chloroflexota bacterium]